MQDATSGNLEKPKRSSCGNDNDRQQAPIAWKIAQSFGWLHSNVRVSLGLQGLHMILGVIDIIISTPRKTKLTILATIDTAPSQP
jgi:hypothetical protein